MTGGQGRSVTVEGGPPGRVRTVVVSAKGAARWQAGHPWIYRTDVYDEPRDEAGIVAVTERRGRHLGQALYSPRSEIRLRLLTRGRESIDAAWWGERIAAAAGRRSGLTATAYRVVHAEADGLPSLVVDRYGPYVVAQLLSAGIEQRRDDVVAGIGAALAPAGILLRNDVAIRRHEGLPLEVTLASGEVPEVVEVMEAGVKYLAAPWTGQKTGAFLDQRENRGLVAAHAGSGPALDLFTYHGSFALHLARRAAAVTAVDSSGEALARGAKNAALNGFTNITWREANGFDLLRELERRHESFDTIVLDPPAFAKTKQSVPRALAGYKEINLRAMRLLASGGVLFTCSCSYHVGRAAFGDMLVDAARDSRRRLELLALLGAGRDHPELLNVPETGYLKGALLRAVD
jgi:23S rRNA (cytosine1962-C5)-methyltransferase